MQRAKMNAKVVFGVRATSVRQIPIEAQYFTALQRKIRHLLILVGMQEKETA
jgi:hypothetical protein